MRIEQEQPNFDSGLIQNSPLGELSGLPEQKNDTIYIVSLLVLMAAKALGLDRGDLVAPATNHPDTKRHPKNGFIISVPGFITL